jgi:hypothetical protein
VELAERTREVSSLVWGYVNLSQAKRARGDGEDALEMAREAERVAQTSGADLETAIATYWTARLRMVLGDRAAVAFKVADTGVGMARIPPARLREVLSHGEVALAG